MSRATPGSASRLPVLDAAALGRATLARQLLLDAADIDVPTDVATAIRAVGGLQAQEPASPYLALWARLPRFGPADLDAAFTQRAVVKATLMRSTLHAVAAADYRAIHPAVAPMGLRFRRQDRAEPPDAATLARLTSILETEAAEPRSLGELRAVIDAAIEAATTSDPGAGPRPDPDVLLWWLRRAVPFIHVPSPGVSWSFGRRPRLVVASAWLSGDGTEPDLEASYEALVRTHLAAFGPARAADIAAWSGVAVGRFRPAIERLDADGHLWHARDDRGRVVLDLPDAPRPAAATPAPPRLLPMWDSVLLAHQDRTRIVRDEDRALVIARNGDTLPTFLVDGRVAGLWWADAGPGGRTRIAIEPFRPIAQHDRRRLEEEGERLAEFVEPHEPAVYARYQRWRIG